MIVQFSSERCKVFTSLRCTFRLQDINEIWVRGDKICFERSKLHTHFKIPLRDVTPRHIFAGSSKLLVNEKNIKSCCKWTFSVKDLSVLAHPLVFRRPRNAFVYVCGLLISATGGTGTNQYSWSVTRPAPLLIMDKPRDGSPAGAPRNIIRRVRGPEPAAPVSAAASAPDTD